MSDVTTYLLNYALDHDIGFEFLNGLDSDWPSVAIPERNKMFINTNWYKQEEVPMIIAHEIGHMLNGDSCYMYNKSSIAKINAESTANKIAIDLLLQYCKDYDIHFNSYIMFIQQFCIPLRYEYIAKRKMAVM